MTEPHSLQLTIEQLAPEPVYHECEMTQEKYYRLNRENVPSQSLIANLCTQIRAQRPETGEWNPEEDRALPDELFWMTHRMLVLATDDVEWVVTAADNSVVIATPADAERFLDCVESLLWLSDENPAEQDEVLTLEDVCQLEGLDPYPLRKHAKAQVQNLGKTTREWLREQYPRAIGILPDRDCGGRRDSNSAA